MSTTPIPPSKQSFLTTAHPRYHPLSLLLGTLSYRLRAHDSALFTRRTPLFTPHPAPTIPLASPELGPSPAPLLKKHWLLSANEFPTLTWTLPPALDGKVREFLLVVEDPDGPSAQPPVHGLFYGIPGDRRTVTGEDLGGGGGDVEGGVLSGERRCGGWCGLGRGRRWGMECIGISSSWWLWGRGWM